MATPASPEAGVIFSIQISSIAGRRFFGFCRLLLRYLRWRRLRRRDAVHFHQAAAGEAIDSRARSTLIGQHQGAVAVRTLAEFNVAGSTCPPNHLTFAHAKS